MKWIILVYMATLIPEKNDIKYIRLVFPIKSYHHCLHMARDINKIELMGLYTEIPFVKSLFWHKVNKGYDKIHADCIYADINEPLPDWTNNYADRLSIGKRYRLEEED